MSWIEKQGFETFGSFNLSELGIDEAWVNFTNDATVGPLWLYQLSSECHGCPYKAVEADEWMPLDPLDSFSMKVPTKFPMKFRFTTGDDFDDLVLQDDLRNKYCDIETSFGEFGVYDVIAGKENTCEVVTKLSPVNIYLPILVVVIFYFLLTAAIICWQRFKITARLSSLFTSNQFPSVAEATDAEQGPKRVRLGSLDTFRGLSIVIMMFVHDGGGQYQFMQHATWDGLTVTDLVFPWFLWIMGVCIPISVKSQLKRKTGKWTIFKGILIRSLKMVALGLILQSRDGPHVFKTFRLPGVLQRFGLCYCSAASIFLLCADEGLVQNLKSKNKALASIQDFLFLWKGWIISGVLLVTHTLITFLLEVPGCPTGYLGPGGLHNGNAYPSHCIGGAAGYIDKQILTTNHIFIWPTALFVYQADFYDPEGLLGTLTSIFQVWLGVQAGMTLQVYKSHKSRLLRWSLWAIVYGGVGAALCGAKQTGGLIPVNKNLWSLSFVLVTTCFALILLSLFYILIDVLRVWSGTPFLQPGMNSILLYLAHLIGLQAFPFHFNYLGRLSHTHFLQLVESLWGVSLWVLVGVYLHSRKFYWSI